MLHELADGETRTEIEKIENSEEKEVGLHIGTKKSGF
jgi:hypothetical protein